jgi:phosphate/sulfate permease
MGWVKNQTERRHGNRCIIFCHQKLESLSIAVAALACGKKVAGTVGEGIAPLVIPSAFVAQISSAFGMHLFSMMGIPVSTSFAFPANFSLDKPYEIGRN